MTQELQEKKIKKRLWSLLVVVLLLAAMLVTSVVGWFSISKTPRVNNKHELVAQIYSIRKQTKS